jgi:hypothetical protein
MISLRCTAPAKALVPTRVSRKPAAQRTMVVRASGVQQKVASVASAVLLLSLGVADAAFAEYSDPVTAKVVQANKIQDLKIKDGMCARKSCKVCPADSRGGTHAAGS